MRTHYISYIYSLLYKINEKLDFEMRIFEVFGVTVNEYYITTTKKNVISIK